MSKKNLKDDGTKLSFFEKLRNMKFSTFPEKLLGVKTKGTHKADKVENVAKPEVTSERKKHDTAHESIPEKSVKKASTTLKTNKKEKKDELGPVKKESKSIKNRRKRKEEKNAYERTKIERGKKTIALKNAKVAASKIEEERKTRVTPEKSVKQEKEIERTEQSKVEQKSIDANKVEAEIFARIEATRKARVKAERAAKRKAEQERIEHAKAEAERLVKEREHKSLGLKSIMGRMKTSKNKEESRFVSTERWKRRILDSKDDIAHKQYNKREDARKFAITGVATLLAAGSLLVAMNVNNTASDYNVPVTEETETSSISERVDYNSPDSPEFYTEIESNIVEEKIENDEKEDLKQENSNIDSSKEEDNSIKDEVTKEVSYEEKMNEFKSFAFKRYMSEFKIGEQPKVSSILNNLCYYENPDGSGSIGYFKNHPNYSISHINIVTNDGHYKTVRLEGKRLDDLLDECTDYSIHFINSKTGGGYGFITKSQLEEIVNKTVDSDANSIMESFTKNQVVKANNSQIDSDNLSR